MNTILPEAPDGTADQVSTKPVSPKGWRSGLVHGGGLTQNYWLAEYVNACVRGLLRPLLVLVVLVAAAGGHSARAGVLQPKPTRLAPASQVVLGSSFRVIRRGVAQIFASGDYLVAGGRVPVVINDALGTTTPFHRDPACSLVALGPPWVVMSCQSGAQYPLPLQLYSLADGTRQTVTPSPGLAPPCLRNWPTVCDVAAVGSYWIEWSAGGYHLQTTFYFQNIQTGELRDDPTNATTFPDLNSPSLAQETCPGVRLIRSVFNPYNYVNPWGSLTYDGQFALATTNSLRVFLERCGTHMRRLLPIQNAIGWHALASSPDVIVWQSAVNRLSGRFLPSLQKFTMPLPSAEVREGGAVEPALTSGALYVYGAALWRTASPAALPRNVSGPRVTHSGTTLTCVRGNWLNAAKFSYEWRVNGRKENATKSRLFLGKSPERRSVNCSVIASNPNGTTTASSAPLHLR